MKSVNNIIKKMKQDKRLNFVLSLSEYNLLLKKAKKEDRSISNYIKTQIIKEILKND